MEDGVIIVPNESFVPLTEHHIDLMEQLIEASCNKTCNDFYTSGGTGEYAGNEVEMLEQIKEFISEQIMAD